MMMVATYPDPIIKKDKIDWEKKKLKLDQLIEKHKGKNSYDCIIPFSGERIVLLHYII